MTDRRFLNPRSPWPWTGLALVGLLALGSFRWPLAATGEGAAESGPATEPAAAAPSSRALPVEVAPLEAAEGYTRRRRYLGELRAARRLRVGFEVPGRVIQVHVRAGSAVAAGEPLATLEGARLEAARAEALAGIQAARAALAEAEAGPRQEVIAATRARVRALEVDRDLAAKRLERQRTLAAGEAGIQEALDAAEAAWAGLGAQLERTRAELAELQAGTRPERLAAARAEVARLEAGLVRLDLDLEDLTLKAPFAGTISARLVDEGAIVALGHPAVELVESGALQAWVGLPPEELASLDLGAQRLSVRGQTLQVAAPRPQPLLDAPTRTVQVVFDLSPDAPGGLRPGELVRMEVERTVQQAGYWLPTLALTQGTRGLWSVFVLPEGEERAKLAAVEVLHTEGERSFVRGTLVPGDRVVLSGQNRLVPGQRVAPVQDREGDPQ